MQTTTTKFEATNTLSPQQKDVTDTSPRFLRYLFGWSMVGFLIVACGIPLLIFGLGICLPLQTEIEFLDNIFFQRQLDGERMGIDGMARANALKWSRNCMVTPSVIEATAASLCAGTFVIFAEAIIMFSNPLSFFAFL